VGALPAGERSAGRFVALAVAVLALVVVVANALGRWQRLRMLALTVRDRNDPDHAE
jgi:cytochrome c-type biogenesis protein CcmH/NrfG